MKTNYILLYITAGSREEAEKLGKGLVEQKLVACANLIDPIRSLYVWKGSYYDEQEVMILAKSTLPLFKQIKEYITAHHTYEVPEIIAVPIIDGLDTYLGWINDNTKQPGQNK